MVTSASESESKEVVHLINMVGDRNSGVKATKDPRQALSYAHESGIRDLSESFAPTRAAWLVLAGYCSVRVAAKALKLPKNAVHRATKAIRAGRVPGAAGRPRLLPPAVEAKLKAWINQRINARLFPTIPAIQEQVYCPSLSVSP